jgi:uncharacterized ion transporter superfamily protein YfcC
VASAFAGISVADGLVSRLIILVVGLSIGILFVTCYAERVRKDPSKSLVYDKKEENEKHFLKSLGDLAGVDRSLVVTTCRSASGLLNLVNPTFAVVMGGLALGRVGYEKWLRFTWPLLIILLILYALVLSLGAFVPGAAF